MLYYYNYSEENYFCFPTVNNQKKTVLALLLQVFKIRVWLTTASIQKKTIFAFLFKILVLLMLVFKILQVFKILFYFTTATIQKKTIFALLLLVIRRKLLLPYYYNYSEDYFALLMLVKELKVS